MTSLFDPIFLGELQLPNRIFMAPLTRCRASAGRVPNDLMVEYYTQRASAGLIISEATAVTPMGVGYPDTPGIWSHEQIEGWKKVTDSVHKAGGKILMQLWHVGRISHPVYLDGAQPVAPSAIAAKGHVSLLSKTEMYPIPRALETSEIADIIAAYRQGAANAKEAGFDGVEIHGANGYLLDQFLQDGSNTRTDHYGGSLENRARLMLEVTDAVLTVWSSGRVGMHLAPRADAQSMGDSNLLETFTYLARELGKRKLAFLCAREHLGVGRIGPELKKAFGGVFIANEKLTYETASNLVDKGEADAVAFGQLFIANPDLPERFLTGAALNQPHPETFYPKPGSDIPHSVGYIDYLALKASTA